MCVYVCMYEKNIFSDNILGIRSGERWGIEWDQVGIRYRATSYNVCAIRRQGC